MRYLVQTVLLIFCMAGVASAGDLANKVRPGHPRLMLLDEDVPALEKGIKENPLRATWYQSVRESSENLLTVPVLTYARDNRGNTLNSCGQALDRIYRLGLVRRIERDSRFAQRAIEEMMTACNLDAWCPAHFLDTAELTHAMAIGYDWFYNDLTPEQRSTIRAAICQKGLQEGMAFYDTSWPIVTTHFDFNWALCNHNWNQVCNGGMTMGALAVADEEPDLAERVLSAALKSIRLPMQQYAPDGGWGEGPGYWAYATLYNAYFLAALETAIGPSAIEPFLKMPGFDRTGDFRIQVVGPSNAPFNFADSHDTVGDAPEMFWLARKFDRPVYAWHAEHVGTPSPLNVIWYSPDQKNPQKAGLPLDAYFRHVGTVFLRGAWDDDMTVYVGFKGGDNAVNHSHLDLGTFVLDAGGCRWALDLGRDSYALPDYFILGKALYYRLKTESHNTLLFDGLNQRPNAKAPIVAFHSTPELAFAVADLSEAYDMPAGKVRRGMALIARRHVLVKDEIRIDKPYTVTWQMHTRATATIDGRTATLRQGEKVLTARIVEPETAVFEFVPANAPPPQEQQPDVHKLTIQGNLPAGEHHITVMLCPGESAESPELASKQLDAWIAMANASGGTSAK